MGNLAMYVVLGLALSFGIAAYTLSRSSVDSAENAADYYASLAAKNISRSALNHYMYKIKKKPTLIDTFSITDTYYKGGTVTVAITDLGGENRRVEANANFYGVTHTASADITVSINGCDYEWAIYAGKKAKIEEDGAVFGNVYAGEKIELKDDALLDGDAHAVKEIKNDDDGTITGIEEVPASKVTPPIANFALFDSLAQLAGQYYTSDIEFKSSGSPYSGIWYTTEKAKIFGGAVINGTIVAEDDIEFKGDDAIVTASPANYPILVSRKKVKTDKDGLSATGVIYAGEHVELKGDDNVITGAVIARKEVKSEGEGNIINWSVYYTTGLVGIYICLEDDWYRAMTAGDEIKLASGTITGDIYAWDKINQGTTTVSGSVTARDDGKVPKDSLPQVDWGFFADTAAVTGQYVDGDKDFDSGGTYSGFWYLTGKAKILNNSTINGTIVAEDDIEIKENTAITIHANPPKYPVLISAKEIKYKENSGSDIRGFVYAVKDIDVDNSTDFNFTGALYTGKKYDGHDEPILFTFDTTYTMNLKGIGFPYGTNGVSGGTRTAVTVNSIYE